METANSPADLNNPKNSQPGTTFIDKHGDMQDCEAVLLKIIALAESVLGSDVTSPQKSELLPVLLGVHAYALQGLLANQNQNDTEDQGKTPNRSRQQVYLAQIEDASRIAALRAIAMREDALEYYRAGWRVETWTPKKGNGSTYAQFRRSVNGKREAKYLGVVVSSKGKKKVDP